MKGGTNKLSFAKPEVNQTTSSGAIQGAMFDQKENNQLSFFLKKKDMAIELMK